MVINLDGVLGYFDEANTYIFRERSLQMMLSLSHNFRIIAYCNKSASIIKKLCKLLGDYQKPFYFDAVYQIGRKQNLTI